MTEDGHAPEIRERATARLPSARLTTGDVAALWRIVEDAAGGERPPQVSLTLKLSGPGTVGEARGRNPGRVRLGTSAGQTQIRTNSLEGVAALPAAGGARRYCRNWLLIATQDAKAESGVSSICLWSGDCGGAEAEVSGTSAAACAEAAGRMAAFVRARATPAGRIPAPPELGGGRYAAGFVAGAALVLIAAGAQMDAAANAVAAAMVAGASWLATAMAASRPAVVLPEEEGGADGSPFRPNPVP